MCVCVCVCVFQNIYMCTCVCMYGSTFICVMSRPILSHSTDLQPVQSRQQLTNLHAVFDFYKVNHQLCSKPLKPRFKYTKEKKQVKSKIEQTVHLYWCLPVSQGRMFWLSVCVTLLLSLSQKDLFYSKQRKRNDPISAICYQHSPRQKLLQLNRWGATSGQTPRFFPLRPPYKHQRFQLIVDIKKIIFSFPSY